MNARRYKVIFTGQLAPGKTPLEVRTNLVRMVGFPAEALERFFAEPSVVRSGIDRKAAWRCWEQFRKAGALCVVEALEPPGELLAPGRPYHLNGKPATVVCPWCRTEQTDSATCKACGVDLKTDPDDIG